VFWFVNPKAHHKDRKQLARNQKVNVERLSIFCPLTFIKQNDAKGRRTLKVSYHLHEKGTNGRAIKWIFEMGCEGINYQPSDESTST
jgi:hypothetical protein